MILQLLVRTVTSSSERGLPDSRASKLPEEHRIPFALGLNKGPNLASSLLHRERDHVTDLVGD
jgi:hypothetical protein